MFEFNEQYYQQIDGLSMGNGLAPPLANLFTVKVEKRALDLGLIFREWKR